MPPASSSEPIFPHRCEFVTTRCAFGGILRYPSPVLDKTGSPGTSPESSGLP